MRTQILNFSKRILTCEKGHVKCGDHGIRSAIPLELKTFRLIDTVDQHLVETSISERYLTLSYVWGLDQNFRLCKGNLAHLMTTGSLANLQAKLPQTISDAITLVRSLGERYIWIDSLCLIKDDPDDMMNGIESMDTIYEQSFLAIVAANGDNADAGLPRVRPGASATCQIIEEVLPGVRLALAYNPEDFLKKSKYYSRGWT